MPPLVVAGSSMEVAELMRWDGRVWNVMGIWKGRYRWVRFAALPDLLRHHPFFSMRLLLFFIESPYATISVNGRRKKALLHSFRQQILHFLCVPFFHRVIFAGDFQETGREKIIIPSQYSTLWLHSFMSFVYLFFDWIIFAAIYHEITRRDFYLL